jgi:hypothetical protein
MGDLTRAEYQERVLLALKNLRSTHPVVTAGIHTDAINHAVNRLIRMAPDMFPEHNNNSWTQGPTTVGDNLIALPENLLVLREVRSADSSTSPTWEDTKERVVPIVDTDTIGLLGKETTQAGYPRICDRKGTNLIYWPTTRTGYTTYLRFYGIAGEAALTADGETFRTHEHWDAAIVFLAAEEVATYLGWTDRAKELLAAAKEHLGSSANILGKERAIRGLNIGIAGSPR